MATRSTVKRTTTDPLSPNNAVVKILDATIAYVQEHGAGDLSLRQIADGIGTSHRMLIYHFGSADGFWEAVLREIRYREQRARPRSAPAGTDLAESMQQTWERFSADSYLPVMRLLFTLYVKAINEPERFGDFLDDAVGGWIKHSTTSFEQAGFEREEAQVRARILLATMRGLLLNLLATGDRASTSEAMRRAAQMLARKD
ncbi:TetR/AcrR family transcriptional regulator [Burkholderia arboris]|uniref:TetR/AcrR family transcriptional regulator n=1 Tax=Burkholderia arboris TaxID=488730 RepID=UPI001CA42BF6|nr:TetR/AcrR family transcriptional regulator [Burkholderia arboris]MBY8608749.1 TetR/AcrR family transcriptional regulator [Burkholderia arboris]MCA8052742.1 TetR/AcrR family transcriptional regulator [Burkholderia arboris]